MTSTTPALEISDVSLSYGDGDSAVVALDRVNLRVLPGEVVAVIGPSGAGKSSLLAVAGALARPDAGSVRIHGREVTTLSKGAAARFRLANIGFVFQSGNLLPALTAEDQLRLVAGLAGNRSADIPAMLEAVGMHRRAHHRPGAMSGGERQRVGIARALINAPTLILADEPTAALDRRRSHEVAQLLADRAHAAGVAVVIVTHDHDILAHCDRVIEMIDGALEQVDHRPQTAA